MALLFTAAMKITPQKINRFMLLKLPLAYFGGVRVQSLDDEKAIVTIKHRWINQNPFKSLFWAAQGMAAEMSTGVLVIQAIEDSGKKISMLVTHQESRFFKKATGRINFSCSDGKRVEQAILEAIRTNEGQVIHLTSTGTNEEGIVVSEFTFEWSLKVKA